MTTETAIYLPPPPRWDAVLDDLEDTAKWARDCERALLPVDTVFPQRGQIWESLCECDVAFFVILGNLTVPGGRTRLPAGESVVIVDTEGDRPVAAQFVPVRYQALQEQLIPAEYLGRRDFRLYTLLAKTAVMRNGVKENLAHFDSDFRLLGMSRFPFACPGQG